MEQTKKRLTDLIATVTEELYRIGYSPATIPRFNLVWQKLQLYGDSKSLDYFSEELGENFLKEFFNYPSKYDTKFPYQSRIAVRAIRMLGDYQLYGIILRKRKQQQPDPPEEFLKSIREFVSYSYNECGNAASTVNRKVFIIRYFLEIMVSYNLKNCNEMRKNHIIDAVKSLVVLNKSTFNRYIESIRVFLRFLYKYEYTKEDLQVFLPKTYEILERKIPTVWSREEVEKLLSSVDRGNPCGKRDYAILLIVAKLGLRDSDICNLKLENFNWQTNRIEFSQYKTKQLVSLPLFSDIGWSVIEYLKNGRPITDSQYLFIRQIPPYEKLVSTYAILQRYLALAEIKTAPDRPHGMHVLRHALACRLLEEQIPIEVISQVLGHANITSTQDYLHVDINALRKCALEIEFGGD